MRKGPPLYVGVPLPLRMVNPAVIKTLLDNNVRSISDIISHHFKHPKLKLEEDPSIYLFCTTNSATSGITQALEYSITISILDRVL